MRTINVMMASLAALLLAGCSQNEVMETNPDARPQMTFGVYTGTPTRGVDTDNTSIKDDPSDASKYGGFGIMGYFTGSKPWEEAKAATAPGFMHNQMVKWDATSTGAWTYSPIKYWPNNPGDKISFFAYAPYESAWESGTKAGVTISNATTKGIPYINFKLKEGNDLPKMVDLVVAQKTDQQYSTNSGKVSFQFEHTLSRVSFKAKLGTGQFDDMDGTESFVFITEMWVVGSNHGNTAADGNLSLLDPSAPSNASSKFYTAATWKELHWNYEGATIPTKDFNLKPILKTTDGSITESNPTTGHSTTVTGVKITKDSQTTPVALFPDKQFLYLIPVGDTNVDATLGSGCADGEVQIGFHYDIVTKDKTNTGQYIASHAESVIKIPAGHLKRQKTYQYTLTINLHSIVIDKAEVTEWGNEVTAAPVQ